MLLSCFCNTGVGCFLLAALVGFFVHGSNTRDIQAKLGYRCKIASLNAHIGEALGRAGQHQSICDIYDSYISSYGHSRVSMLLVLIFTEL